MKGPGLFVGIPGVDRVAAVVDLRTVVYNIPKQPTLTRDNVPVTVDAVVYSRVKDPEASGSRSRMRRRRSALARPP